MRAKGKEDIFRRQFSRKVESHCTDLEKMYQIQLLRKISRISPAVLDKKVLAEIRKRIPADSLQKFQPTSEDMILSEELSANQLDQLFSDADLFSKKGNEELMRLYHLASSGLPLFSTILGKLKADPTEYECEFERIMMRNNVLHDTLSSLLLETLEDVKIEPEHSARSNITPQTSFRLNSPRNLVRDRVTDGSSSMQSQSSFRSLSSTKGHEKPDLETLRYELRQLKTKMTNLEKQKREYESELSALRHRRRKELEEQAKIDNQKSSSFTARQEQSYADIINRNKQRLKHILADNVRRKQPKTMD